MASALIAAGVVAAFTVVAAFGGLFFKRGSASFSLNLFKQLRNTNLMIGIALYALPTPVYLWALQHANLSTLFPVNSLTYIWVSLLSMKFLGERMNRFKWLGIALIVAGVSMLTYSVI